MLLLMMSVCDSAKTNAGNISVTNDKLATGTVYITAKDKHYHAETETQLKNHMRELYYANDEPRPGTPAYL